MARHLEGSAGSILLVQFDDLEQQAHASNLGMWTFLATEVMFFGGLIATYVVYRTLSPTEFASGSRHLSPLLGGVNTVVLLSSSLAMAMAVRSVQLNRRRPMVRYLLLTVLLGACFLGIKAVEYLHEYRASLVPGLNFRFPEQLVTGLGGSQFDPRRFEMFFVLYFFMTGLHALHLIIGIGLLGVMAVLAHRSWFSGSGETQIEAAGLYWHFVDVVWVFLYPLLYLIDVQS
jgi:cytochrome c oxidase subunit 3